MVALGLLLWLVAATPGVDRSLVFADQRLEQGLFEEAITEYKRYIFFNQSAPDNELGYAYFQMGMAYRGQRLWDQAGAMFDKSIQAENRAEVRDDRRITLAVTQMAGHHYDQAGFVLLKVETFGVTPDARRRAAFLRGISSIYATKWDEAEEAFRVFASNGDPASLALAAEISRVMVSARAHGLKSTRLAKGLATVLPGLGQVYASDWKDGLGALAINAATTLLLVHDISHGQTKNALFNSSMLFGRFYGGNRQGAEDAAKRYNDEVSRKLAARILEILEKR